ncbi:hypothetical protein STAS_05082 [Striga asiatica]|uniref:Uncharacterized protein n=1 Tax=Striga asiatica TaxID=4170 RepID=A0A5A7P9A6_STRAF|nr:hypothetical protein STAS_05082 [Striga asiatica]
MGCVQAICGDRLSVVGGDRGSTARLKAWTWPYEAEGRIEAKSPADIHRHMKEDLAIQIGRSPLHIPRRGVGSSLRPQSTMRCSVPEASARLPIRSNVEDAPGLVEEMKGDGLTDPLGVRRHPTKPSSPPSTRTSKKLETMKMTDANPTTAALLKKSSKNKKMDRVETSLKESSRDLSMFKFKSSAHEK